jgi:hypothetical protein
MKKHWEKKLMTKLKNKKNIKNTLKRMLFENIKIKLLCFVLAVITYILIGFFQRDEKIFSCKLQVTGLKSPFTISNEIPDYIKIVIKDKPRIIDKITDNDFTVSLDLSNIEETNTYNIKLKANTPAEMQSFFSSMDLIPNNLKVTIEKLDEKNVPVVINYIGNLEDGYIIRKTSIDPQEVTIQGAEKLLSKVKFIETEKININGEKQSFKKEVNLVSPYHIIKILGFTKAQVIFDIEKESNFVTFKYENVYFDNLKPQFKAWLERVPVY